MKRYWLKAGFTDWMEVTKSEWIAEERHAGFHPRYLSFSDKPEEVEATGGWGGGKTGISGKITRDPEKAPNPPHLDRGTADT